jgi:hypothetical protein
VEKIEVEVIGKSRYEIAHRMAMNILTVIEGYKLADVTREQYLSTVTQCVNALGKETNSG